jgi:hypothetical protein
MDRRNALEKLEIVRHDSDDLSDSELADAIAALDQDPAARQEFDRRLQLDAKIATAMQAVEVPAGLKDKLLAATTATNVAPEPVKSPKRSRRGFLVAMTSVAAAAIAVLVFLQQGPTKVSYHGIVQQAPRDVPATPWPAVTHDFNLPNWLVRKPRTSQQLWPSESAPLDGQTEPTSVAVAGRSWVLIVTPLDRVEGAPNFGPGGTLGSGKLSTTHHYQAWQDTDFVYVLFVKGSQNDLDAVYQREFRGTAA